MDTDCTLYGVLLVADCPLCKCLQLLNQAKAASATNTLSQLRNCGRNGTGMGKVIVGLVGNPERPSRGDAEGRQLAMALVVPLEVKGISQDEMPVPGATGRQEAVHKHAEAATRGVPDH